MPPSDNYDGREITSLNAKIDLVGVKLDNMGALIDERWKSMESRFDSSARQTQQSVELLTASFVKLESSLRISETELSGAKADIRVLRTEFDDWKRAVEAIQNNLKWVVQSLVAGAITLAATIIAFFLTTKH